MKKIALMVFTAVLVVTFCIPGFARRKGKKGNKKANFMEQFDTDKDGKISMDEWLEKSKARFKKMDTNSDGFIDKNEMKEKKKARKGRRGKKKK